MGIGRLVTLVRGAGHERDNFALRHIFPQILSRLVSHAREGNDLNPLFRRKLSAGVSSLAYIWAGQRARIGTPIPARLPLHPPCFGIARIQVPLAFPVETTPRFNRPAEATVIFTSKTQGGMSVPKLSPLIDRAGMYAPMRSERASPQHNSLLLSRLAVCWPRWLARTRPVGAHSSAQRAQHSGGVALPP